MRDYVTKVNDTAPLTSGQLDAQEFNSFASELENAVTRSGITLDPAIGPDSSTAMLAQSMVRHVGAALACSDSGVANAYVLTMIGDYEPPTALVDEMRIRFRPGNANTGASTAAFEGLASKAILDHALAPLSGGELEAGRECEVIYRASAGSGSWVLPAWANALYVDPNPAAPTEIGDGEGWSVNTGANTGNLNFPGLTNNATLDATDVFARHKSGAGHRGITGAQLLAAVAGAGGLLALRLITTSGNYVPTTGAKKALAFAVGGGGGGEGSGGSKLARGGGGGAGATVMKLIDLTGVTSVACTIGAGGAGGLAVSGASGGSGGSTVMTGYITAPGGSGATQGGMISPGGASNAAAAVGDFVIPGSNGDMGTLVWGLPGGLGGSSFFGPGGVGTSVPGPSGDPANGADGQAGRGYGAGGGGGSTGNAYAGKGGAGAAGCILILEFA